MCKPAASALVAALFFSSLALSAGALAQPPEPRHSSPAPSGSATAASVPRDPFACPDAASIRIFPLRNLLFPNDMNEAYSAVRNMLPPNVHTFLAASQSVLLVCGSPADQAVAQKILEALQTPQKNFRLTYTVSEKDAGRRIGSRQYSIILAAGQPTTFKQGSRVPIATALSSASSPSSTQFTYIDVGMNFEAQLTDLGDAASLKSNIDQSSVNEEKVGSPSSEPVIRQTELKGSVVLTPGKPLLLGALNIPDSTHSLEIEVTMDRLP